ncbi:glycosyltransferase family 4 protein [uncultured Endozoicomonas sp.]|uniref:glycosyltransferase family 4 protein n=1 Tax=uncultured Endozoicomonas sp. TaxID=432652 RepID=UPI00260FF686|nr:glycosyltransferase family 4 protein [uncultured Endozoicomonas sp.]
MVLAFALYKYFPYGGLQRDFLRIALECQKKGHEIQVYTTQWQGEKPEGFSIHFLKPKGFSNHQKMSDFAQQVHQKLSSSPATLLVGFNKMPGLDVYYAADTCYKAKTDSKSFLYKMTARYKAYCAFEASVFGQKSHTVSLLISALQKPVFQDIYATSDDRIHLLPPGISKDRCRSENADNIRREFRQSFNLSDEDHLVLMVGSGFKTKGLDRAIKAIASLPEATRARTQFYIIGQDNQKPFIALAKRLGVLDNVRFFAGRDDIPRFLLGADLLIHPAYNENTGTVLLEALVSGLPVLTTDVCGYAHYILDAEAGQVIQSPFSQDALNKATLSMLTSEQKQQWSDNAVRFSKQADLYSMPERAADIIIAEAFKTAGASTVEADKKPIEVTN